jgi:hypothetical protein
MRPASISPTTVVFAASTKITLLKKIMFFGIPMLIGAAALTSKDPAGDRIAVIGFVIFFVGALAWSLLQSDAIELDVRARRIKIKSSWFGRLHSVTDVGFDECEGVGIERVSGGEGPDTFRTFLQLKGGARYQIPQNDTNNAGEDLAKETLARFVAFTRLPRLDNPSASPGLSSIPASFPKIGDHATVAFEDVTAPSEFIWLFMIAVIAAGFFGPTPEPILQRALVTGSFLVITLTVAAFALRTSAIEIDTQKPRIRLYRGLLGYRVRKVFEVDARDCAHVGIESLNYSLHPFLQLRNGKRYRIPTTVQGFNDRWTPRQVAELVSIATKLPILNDPPVPA